MHCPHYLETTVTDFAGHITTLKDGDVIQPLFFDIGIVIVAAVVVFVVIIITIIIIVIVMFFSYLFIYLFLCLFTYLSIYLSVYPFVHLCFSVSLSIPS